MFSNRYRWKGRRSVQAGSKPLALFVGVGVARRRARRCARRLRFGQHGLERHEQHPAQGGRVTRGPAALRQATWRDAHRVRPRGLRTLRPRRGVCDEDYTITSATQRSLYSYLPNNASKLEPDVAAGPPAITDGGKTVTIQIKPHIYFSPPVNREVNSGDVAYAIERGANPNVANAYFSSYFGDIVGAEKANGGPIPGIETPSRYTIVFHLTKPTASLLVGALSLPLSAPVPPEFAKPLDAHKPTTYGSEYLVATGPYMLKSDSTGKFLGIGYQPGKSATLVRNPRWNPHTDFRPAYLNQIDINIGGEPTVIGKQVLQGEDVVQNDVPAQSIVKEAYEHYPQQITFTPGSGDYYASLNTAHGPFTNIDLRKAVWAALDRDAIVKARGGPLAAAADDPLPLPRRGRLRTGGWRRGAEGGLQRTPRRRHGGRREVHEARRLPQRQVHRGQHPAAGRLDRRTAGSDGADHQPDAAEPRLQNPPHAGRQVGDVLQVLHGALAGDRRLPQRRLGTRLRRSADGAVFVPFYGPAIRPEGNANWSQLNDPQINAAMEKATLVVGEPARADAWAKIDEMLVAQAAAAPEIYAIEAQIEGKSVAGVNQLWNTGAWDYDFTSLK